MYTHSRNGDDSVGDLLAQECLGDLLHLLQDHGGDFLGGKHLFAGPGVDLHVRLVILVDDLEGEEEQRQALSINHFLTNFLCLFGLLPRASTMSPTITVIHGFACRFSQSLDVVSF